MVEKREEWWSVDQRISETKKVMKAKEEREVSATHRSLRALKGELRARVTARAATSQPRDRTDEAIAAALARGVNIRFPKSDIFTPL